MLYKQDIVFIFEAHKPTIQILYQILNDKAHFTFSIVLCLMYLSLTNN